MDAALEAAQAAPVARTGDIFVMGDHRLLCGDATNLEAMSKFMNGASAAMTFTAPVVFRTFFPTVQDRLVLTLVIGPP